MTTSNETNDKVTKGLDSKEAAMCRSAIYELFAIAFGPPTGELTSMLAREGCGELWVDLFGALGIEGAVSPARVLSLRPMDEAAYANIFGHTARGKVPPFETEYGSDTAFRQPSDMADILGFFAAFGLTLDPSTHERPDHVRSECEFMAFLAQKEALARDTGDDEMQSATRYAEKLFLQEHLGRFACALGARLYREDPHGFYGAIGRLLGVFVRSECERIGARVGMDGLPLRPIEDDPAPMACGSGECGGSSTASSGSCTPSCGSCTP